jgi:hypothetical protein
MPSRIAGCACIAVFAALAVDPSAAHAGGRDLLVLDRQGRVEHHRATGAVAAEARPPGRARPARAAKKRTVARELVRLRDSGAITPEDAASRRRVYDDAKRAARKLRGTRRTELTAVLLTLDDVARRGLLTASRIAPLWLTLERNVEWWTTGPLPTSGQRTGFDGSELVWQYYPGQGMQIQWLGTFGKLNALAKTRSASNDPRISAMTSEILALASERAGGLAWEYEFAYGGGAAPWVSSLAQGTGLQALARAAVRLGRQADVLPVTQRALAIFDADAPEGVRVPAKPGWAGPHYAQYSFAPSIRILNGFTQSIVGLHDYAELTGDATALRLYDDGQRELAREVPEYDTGAWSLYSIGSSRTEANVAYHELARDFLLSMCDRTQVDVYCETALRFSGYELEPPSLRVGEQRLRGGRAGSLRLRLSKISSVRLEVRRGDKLVLSRSLGTIPYGVHRVAWSVPRRAGTYDVRASARDLNGNTGAQDGTVEVLAPVKRHRRG